MCQWPLIRAQVVGLDHITHRESVTVSHYAHRNCARSEAHPLSRQHETLPRVEPTTLIGLAILAILAIGLLLFLASVPLLWYLAVAALFFSGLIAPAFGCLVLGGLASLFALARRA